MAKTANSDEQKDELQRLYKGHEAASAHASLMLAKYGMTSDEFGTADASVGVFWRRIREILGSSGRDWMS